MLPPMRLAAATFALLALLAAAPATWAQQDPPVGLRPVGTPLRLVVIPIEVKGRQPPSTARLRGMVARMSRWLARASNDRIRVEAAIAPRATGGALTPRLRGEDTEAFAVLLERAAAQGVPVDGAIPIYVAPGLRTYEPPSSNYRSGGRPNIGVIVRSNQWRDTNIVVHELGHALGLSHANLPACPRGVHVCRHGAHRRSAEYGDRFDIMGLGGDRFGAFGMVALGLARVTDAPPGRGTTAVPPPGNGDPVLLRLRAANRDWYLESRTRHVPFFDPRRRRVPAGVIVSYAGQQFFPRNVEHYAPSFRYPRTRDWGCRRPDCVVRLLYRPGAKLVVPGVVRARVLGGSPLRVRTTWLDRTPPELTVAGSGVLRAPGAAPELTMDLRAGARGAGLLAVEIDQGGAVTRVAADTVRGLVRGRRGRGAVRVPLAPGAASAAVRLVDAAGNASPWAPLDVARSIPGAAVQFDPPLGPSPLTAPQLTGARTVTIRGRTDPALAGEEVELDAIGTSTSPRVPIAADGTFVMSWSPPRRDEYRLILQVPVEPPHDGLPYRYQEFEGFVRW
jgi:hypothetical protein